MSKDWTGNKKSTYVTLGASSHSLNERQEHDYYATDPRAVTPLLDIIDLTGKTVWEPACGGGHMAIELERNGVTVIATDLYDRGHGQGGVDFLAAQSLAAPYIVTNPPYKYAQEFVEHSIELGADKIAMFLKLTFLEGQKRRKLFNKYPPKTVAVFTKRVTCAINGIDFTQSSAACYAWFIWEKDYNGKPEIMWI